MTQLCTPWRRATRFGAVLAVALTLGSSATSFASRDDAPAGTSPSCGTTQRIRFAPGTDNATVSGTFCTGLDSRFVLRAGAGQTMTVSGIEAGTAFSVVATDGTQLAGGPGETISYLLPATGDYTIIHGPRRSEVTTFSFTVTIPPLSGSPTRVQFPSGTFGTSFRDSVGANAVDRFVLWAGAGHRMAVHVDAAADNATITIAAPDGTVLSSGQTQPLIESLPATGDYIVEVHPTGGNATYQISFWIR